MKSAGSDLILDIDETKNLPLEQRFDELIGCPSQCYYHIQCDGMDAILYLRWRWEDPWQAEVVKNAASLGTMHGNEAVWSEDVFLRNQIAFREEELDLAKAKLIDLFDQSNGEFSKAVIPTE
jgi:hypothetical protein